MTVSPFSPPRVSLDEAQSARGMRSHAERGNEVWRRRNVREAFRVRGSGEIEDASILVVDDVLTTGATVCELAKELRMAGARSVDVLTLARA